MQIDLGQKNDYSGPLAPPDGDSKISYPSLYFTCEKECDIPDEGTAVISFRKVEDAENTRDPEDPKYRYELEVRSIDVGGGKDVSVGDALKKAMRAKMAEKMATDDGDGDE